MTSAYNVIHQALEETKCPDCYGYGKKNDAGPGDISYNEWVCSRCQGTGLNPTYVEQLKLVIDKSLG